MSRVGCWRFPWYSMALYQVVQATLIGLEYGLDEEGGPRSLEHVFRVA